MSRADSICEVAIKYEVIKALEVPDGYLWRAADAHYNVYIKGADFILERKNAKAEKRLFTARSYAVVTNDEIHIDSVAFNNLVENGAKELVVYYSTFGLGASTGAARSRYLLVLETRSGRSFYNISLYENKYFKDENGKETELEYDATITISHNHIRVVVAHDTDMDESAAQLDAGLYKRRGHCFVSERHGQHSHY